MDISDLIKKARTIRRFSDEKVPESDLISLVDDVRLISSSANKQPKKYIIVSGAEGCGKVFPELKWAAYLTNWDGPSEGERPTAYIIVLNDKRISSKADVDIGLVGETIMLDAAEKGIGAAMLQAINRSNISDKLSIDNNIYDIDMVIALGYPGERPVIKDIKDNDHKYYRDEHGIHHVPKRTLDEVLIKII